jgi:general secretion pathway protein K
MRVEVRRRERTGTAARGVALLVVLWVVVLLGVLLGAFVISARTENLTTRFLFDATRARFAAEAGLSLAVHELRRADPQARWVADGRVYEGRFEDAKLEISIIDEAGKVDINVADEATLFALLQAVGIEEPRARRLVDAILDWRDADDLVRPNGAERRDYEAAGLSWGPANMGFQTTGQLQQVLGMTWEIYERLAPHITIYTGQGQPSLGFADAPVLQTVPGVTPEIAAQLVAQRRALAPAELAGMPLMLPNGQPLVAGGGGLTYTVTSKATLPNGAWTSLVATVRPGGAPGRRAYSILGWREGTADE